MLPEWSFGWYPGVAGIVGRCRRYLINYYQSALIGKLIQANPLHLPEVTAEETNCLDGLIYFLTSISLFLSDKAAAKGTKG
jgi:hypothetical protein